MQFYSICILQSKEYGMTNVLTGKKVTRKGMWDENVYSRKWFASATCVLH